MKASGYGRLGGNAGIAEFTELRWSRSRPCRLQPGGNQWVTTLVFEFAAVYPAFSRKCL